MLVGGQRRSQIQGLLKRSELKGKISGDDIGEISIVPGELRSNVPKFATGVLKLSRGYQGLD